MSAAVNVDASARNDDTRGVVRLLPLVVLLLGCETAAPPAGPDLFRVAVSGVSGGSLLGVWGDGATSSAFIAGGYVGVDRALVTDGRVGRLVAYTAGRFETRCATDATLWWVHGVRAMGELTVYAVGDDARVVRLRDGRCETLTVDVPWPAGRPTFWGVYARRPDDVWMVGGSVRPDGPRGVVVRYDGERFTQVVDLPVEARDANLYKITAGRDGALMVVGANGLVLRYDGTRWARLPATVRDEDDRLFTVSCVEGRDDCYAVGGAGSGVLLRGDATRWESVATLGDPPGLNGVWAQDDEHVFVVGVGGYTAVVGGARPYVPTRRPTAATLHGVGGFTGVAIAVGGELDERSASQRGVILVRGDDAARFTFDGVVFEATGDLRPSSGGGGQ